MFAIIGIIVVLGSILVGFGIEGGNLGVLIQPVELLIIFGVACGAFFIANPPGLIFGTLKALPTIFTAKPKTKKENLELLLLLYNIFSKWKKEGPLSLEAELEEPHKSELFKKYHSVLANHHLVNFLADNLKVIISANIPHNNLDDLMELEIESHQHEMEEPSHAVSRVADALPGLGIVAAVLGIVLTMNYLDKPPSVIGGKVAIALLGTFAGILGCYGFVGPMATALEIKAKEDIIDFKVVKIALVAFVGGTSPTVAIEFARRILPEDGKPTFNELDNARKVK